MGSGTWEELLALDSVRLAPHLLGALVSSFIDGELVVVRLTEVEAYNGSNDPGSHAYRGKTRATPRSSGRPAPPMSTSRTACTTAPTWSAAATAPPRRC